MRWLLGISFCAIACGPAAATSDDGEITAGDGSEGMSTDAGATGAEATDGTIGGGECVCPADGRILVWTRVGAPAEGSMCSVPVAPCGGDVEGTWVVEDVCGEPDNPLTAICSRATWEVLEYEVVGTRTLQGGAYEGEFMPAWSAVSDLPPGCASAPCDEIQAFGASCSEDTDAGCTCSVTLSGRELIESGTYEVVGSTLRTTTDGVPRESEYCRAGDRLFEWQSTE